MKPDDPLNHVLSRLPTPPCDPAGRARALYHATLALQGAVAAGPTRDTNVARRFSRGAWTPAGLVRGHHVGGGIVLWAISHRRTVREKAVTTLPAERAMLTQIETLFGPQLDAVVESGGTAPDIHLSPDAATTASLTQPLLIQFERTGARTTRVISYSGRRVCVKLGERKMCFEPLVTGRGEIILEGERFCWTPGGLLGGYRVTARLLPRI